MSPMITKPFLTLLHRTFFVSVQSKEAFAFRLYHESSSILRFALRYSDSHHC